MTAPRLSIIIPTLNESGHIGELLAQLQHPQIEVIVVDGGSNDATVSLAANSVAQVLDAPKGRAVQMNCGAARARGEWLWFLHADSSLSAPLAQYLSAIDGAGQWGFFPVRLSGKGLVLRMIEKAIAWRSCLSRVATGDQGIFVNRELFTGLGGYAEQPLMEDVALCKALRRVARPAIPRLPLQTSSRRWEQRGVWRTVLLMWRLRFLYFLGANPAWLARQYR